MRSIDYSNRLRPDSAFQASSRLRRVKLSQSLRPGKVDATYILGPAAFDVAQARKAGHYVRSGTARGSTTKSSAVATSASAAPRPNAAVVPYAFHTTPKKRLAASAPRPVTAL